MLDISKLPKIDVTSPTIKAALAALDGPSPHAVNSARSALAAYEVRTDFLEAMEKDQQRISILGSEAIARAAKDARERREREIEQLDLLRRSTVASEAAIQDAQRRELEAKAETKRAYAIAVVGVIVGVAALVLTAWPIVMTRLE